MPTLLQIGAGNIGRGYMAQLFLEAGYRVRFADAVPTLVDALNQAGAYRLRVLDAHERRARELVIGPIDAVLISDTEAFGRAVSAADVLSTAVGVPNLARLAPPLASALRARRKANPHPVNLFLCENTLDAGLRLQSAVMAELAATDALWVEQNVGFVGTSVARMVPILGEAERAADPLLVVADAYRPLPYDQAALRDQPPDVPELRPRRNFPAEVARKLFLYNLCHGSLAFLGAPRGLTYVHETLEQPDLRDVFIGAAAEISRALELEYPGDITATENEAILADMLVRYGNPMLRDTIIRVGRDPVRKLGPDDRLIGPARLCLRHDILPEHIVQIIVAAMRYTAPGDAGADRLQQLMRDSGPPAVLTEICGLSPEEPLFRLILDQLG